MRYGFSVNPVVCQRVVTIYQPDRLGVYRDSVARQPFGISPAIPALVMIEADIHGIAHE